MKIFITIIDPDYLKFLDDLKKPIQNLPSAEEQLDKRLAEQKELSGYYLF